jgi:hypothetical protein
MLLQGSLHLRSTLVSREFLAADFGVCHGARAMHLRPMPADLMEQGEVSLNGLGGQMSVLVEDRLGQGRGRRALGEPGQLARRKRHQVDVQPALGKVAGLPGCQRVLDHPDDATDLEEQVASPGGRILRTKVLDQLPRQESSQGCWPSAW